MIKPYKLKHLPTGLYYQPYKHKGSNLSKRGKIYQTKTNGLSSALKHLSYNPDGKYAKYFTVWSSKNCKIYKDFKDALDWEESYSYNQVKADTLVTDWIIEEI